MLLNYFALEQKVRSLKGLINLVLSKFFQILAITSFKWLYKRPNRHGNSVEIATLSKKLQKIAQRLGVLPPEPRLCEMHLNFSFESKFAP